MTWCDCCQCWGSPFAFTRQRHDRDQGSGFRSEPVQAGQVKHEEKSSCVFLCKMWFFVDLMDKISAFTFINMLELLVRELSLKQARLYSSYSLEIEEKWGNCVILVASFWNGYLYNYSINSHSSTCIHHWTHFLAAIISIKEVASVNESRLFKVRKDLHLLRLLSWTSWAGGGDIFLWDLRPIFPRGPPIPT